MFLSLVKNSQQERPQIKFEMRKNKKKRTWLQTKSSTSHTLNTAGRSQNTFIQPTYRRCIKGL